MTDRAGPASGGAIAPQRHVRRLRFDKIGPARYLPHNDLITAFVRALRRINAPLAYTQGFSPKPRLRFGPPLPVGHCGRGELVDVELAEPGPTNLAATLDAACPSGLSIVGEDVPVSGKRSPMAAARSYHYRVQIAESAPDLQLRIERFLGLATVPVQVERGPGRVRGIDVRRAVQALRANGTAEFEVEIALGEGTLCRPEDVAGVLGLRLHGCTRTAVRYEFENVNT